MTKKTPNTANASRWAGVLLLIAVMILLGWAWWPADEIAAITNERESTESTESTARIGVVVAQNQSFSLIAEATGHLSPWRETIISPEVGGKVVRRRIDEGNSVRAGQILYQLDRQNLELELAEAQVEVTKARAKFIEFGGTRVASSQIDTTNLHQLRVAYQSAKISHEQGSLSENELNIKRRAFEAEFMLSGANRELLKAVNSGLVQAEQRVERATINLERAQVLAPYAGQVADIKIESGQYVGTGTEMMKLLDTRRMKVTVDVLEADMLLIKTGAPAMIRVPALNDTLLAGEVYAVNPRIDPKTGVGRVVVSVPNPNGDLLTGTQVFATLQTRVIPNQIVIPSETVLERQGRDLVFVVKHGRAQWTYVTIDQHAGGLLTISEGISAGDTLAYSGHFAIAHDTPVITDLQDDVFPVVGTN